MIRSIALVSAGTLGSRLTGFVRDAMVAALLGAGAAADAFLVAFQLVTLVRRLLTEGALNAAFVPFWLRVWREHGSVAAAAFAGRALGTIGLGVIAIALILALAAPFVIGVLAPGFNDDATLNAAVTYARLMLPYLAFAGPVAVMIALANAQRRVALSSAAPVLFNLSMIATCAALLWQGSAASQAAWFLAATVGLAGFFQLAMLSRAAGDASPIRIGLDAPMRALIGRALPGMIASAGPQMLIVAGAIVASRAPSAVSWLYFASRLIDLPLGIISTVSGAVLVTEAAHAADDAKAARLATAHGLAAALALALPAAIGLIMLAEPIVQAVFARGAFTAADAQQTARALQMLALGLPAQALIKALAPSFYAQGDTRWPMLATLAGAAIALLAALAMPDVSGIAAAIALGSAASAILLLVRHGQLPLREMRLPSIVAASCLMAAALLGARSVIDVPAWPHLLLLIALGIAANAAGLLAFGAVTLSELRSAFVQRRLREGDARGTGTPTQRQDVNK